MTYKHNYAVAILFSSVFVASLAQAADLFELKGLDSAGKPVEITVTTDIATEFGVTNIKTKLISEGDAVRSVTGLEIRKFITAKDLQGNNLHVTALDGYVVDLPREDIEKYPVLFGYQVDGAPLSVRQKGPAWIIYPVSDHKELDDPAFEARSVWQLKSVEITQK
jgi:hypothetical protein